MTAFILKWIYKGYLLPDRMQTGSIAKIEREGFRFISDIDKEDVGPSELKLYRIMREIAGASNFVYEKKMKKWARSNYHKIDGWGQEARESSRQTLVKLGYLEEVESKFLLIKTKKYPMTDRARALEEEFYKFKNYLKDFSLLNEHEPINVTIWDNLMIWGGLLSITKTMIKEFKKVYPEYEQRSRYGYGTIYLADSFTRTTSRAVTSARSAGSGGSSSSGGGGGSSGGGSGGGTR